MSSAQPTLDDIWLLFREADIRFKETERAMKESSLETDRKFQETDRQFKETNLKIAAVNESIGRLGNKLGAYVEEMVKPAVVRLFQERGIDVHEVHRGVEAKRGGDNIEIDLLVVNTTDVVAVECKSSLSVDDVNEHLVALQKLKKLLPAYADKRVMGAVAAMVMPDDVARYAYRCGLFVLAQSGEHITIRNDAKFQPQGW